MSFIASPYTSCNLLVLDRCANVTNSFCSSQSYTAVSDSPDSEPDDDEDPDEESESDSDSDSLNSSDDEPVSASCSDELLEES